jgi:hypothetical protein
VNLNNEREAIGEIIAGSAVELDPTADLAGDNPKPIMFDFVQPRFAGWRVRGFGGQAGGDEAGRYAIHMLLIAYKRAFNPPFTRHGDSRRRPGPAGRVG